MTLYCITPNSRYAAIGTAEGIALYDSEQRKLLPKLKGGLDHYNVFSPDSMKLLSIQFDTEYASPRDHHGLMLYSVPEGQVIAATPMSGCKPQWFVFWHESSMLVAPFNENACVWNFESGVETMLKARANFSTEGSLCMTGVREFTPVDQEHTTIWDMETGTPLQTLKGRGFGKAITSDHRIVTTEEETLQVWERHRQPGILGALLMPEMIFLILCGAMLIVVIIRRARSRAS
jgi:hypothetical protein